MHKTVDHFLFFSTSINGEILELDEEETRHAAVVLRVPVGSAITVTDGRGTIYTALVTSFEKKRTTAKIVDRRVVTEPAERLDFYIGIPEKEAFETSLEELVPLGVTSITPLVCRYCQQKWWRSDWDKLVRRFEKKMIVAAKQSWNPLVTRLHEPVHFSRAVDDAAQDGSFCVVAELDGLASGGVEPSGFAGSRLSCFIGPPGGFAPDEIELFRSKGFPFTRLGGYRLKTELAATVLAAIVTMERQRGRKTPDIGLSRTIPDPGA